MIIVTSPPKAAKGVRVLIVEDNATFRQSFKESLEILYPGIEIQELDEGSRCLEEVKAFRPELIFMDIRLPGENGLVLTKKIKAKHPEMKIIVITSYDNPEYRDAAVQSGASRFFSKDSLSFAEIKALIDSVSSPS